MERLPEFIANHAFLFIALGLILVMIVVTEVQQFTRKFNDLSPGEAVRLINDNNALVLDVREDKETREGMLQGAKHIPVGVLPKRIDEISKAKERPVLVYCRSGNRSVNASNTLVKHGFTQVNNLKGGFIAWRNDNLPVVRR